MVKTRCKQGKSAFLKILQRPRQVLVAAALIASPLHAAQDFDDSGSSEDTSAGAATGPAQTLVVASTRSAGDDQAFMQRLATAGIAAEWLPAGDDLSGVDIYVANGNANATLWPVMLDKSRTDNSVLLPVRAGDHTVYVAFLLNTVYPVSVVDPALAAGGQSVRPIECSSATAGSISARSGVRISSGESRPADSDEQAIRALAHRECGSAIVSRVVIEKAASSKDSVVREASGRWRVSSMANEDGSVYQIPALAGALSVEGYYALNLLYQNEAGVEY